MRLNSGDTAPRSGSYRVVDAQGRVQNMVDMQEGDTLPPTQSSQNHFEID